MSLEVRDVWIKEVCQLHLASQEQNTEEKNFFTSGPHIAPLHIFMDLSVLLGHAALFFQD